MMAFQVYTFIDICVYWVYHSDRELENESNISHDWERFSFWLQVEVLSFLAQIISSMLFLFFRSILRNSIDIFPKVYAQVEDCDFLEAQQILIGIIGAFTAPAAVTATIIHHNVVLQFATLAPEV